MHTSSLQHLDVAFKRAIAALASTGCEAAPSQNVLGSYFPSWMICAIGGLIAAAVLRKLLTFARMSSWLPAPSMRSRAPRRPPPMGAGRSPLRRGLS